MTTQWFDDPKSFRFKFVRRLHKLAGRLIDDPFTIGSLRYYRERDPEYNQKSTPSVNDHIEVLALWAFEMYTPSNVGNLEQGFLKLGWGKDGFDWTREDPISWLRRSRQSQGGGWMNLGRIYRPEQNSRRRIGEPLRAPLPDFADYAYAHLYSLTPSLTCLAICFVFKSEERGRIEGAMREIYSTFMERGTRSRRIIQPQHQKTRKIRSIRTEWRRATAAWFSKYAPGLLCRDPTAVDLPTCEFTILEGVEPYSSVSGTANTLLFSTDLWHAPYVFDDQTHAGLSFAWDSFGESRFQHHAVLASSKDSLKGVNVTGYGSQAPECYIDFVAKYYDATLTRWSCSVLLDYLIKQVSVVRDIGRTLVASRRGKLAIERLQEATADGIDIPAICPELKEFAQPDGWFEYDVAAFSWRPFPPLGRAPEEAACSLSTVLMSDITFRTERLHTTEAGVKAFLLQQGNLAAAYENVRLQRSVRILTFIAILIAIIAAIEPTRNFLNSLWYPKQPSKQDTSCPDLRSPGPIGQYPAYRRHATMSRISPIAGRASHEHKII